MCVSVIRFYKPEVSARTCAQEKRRQKQNFIFGSFFAALSLMQYIDENLILVYA